VQFDVSGTGTAEYLISLRQDTCLASKARQPNSGVGEDVILDPWRCLVLSNLTWHSRQGIAWGARASAFGSCSCWFSFWILMPWCGVMSETELLGGSPADDALCAFTTKSIILAGAIQNCSETCGNDSCLVLRHHMRDCFLWGASSEECQVMPVPNQPIQIIGDSWTSAFSALLEPGAVLILTLNIGAPNSPTTFRTVVAAKGSRIALTYTWRCEIFTCSTASNVLTILWNLDVYTVISYILPQGLRGPMGSIPSGVKFRLYPLLFIFRNKFIPAKCHEQGASQRSRIFFSEINLYRQSMPWARVQLKRRATVAMKLKGGTVKTQSNTEESTNIGAPLKNKYWTLVCLMFGYIILFAAGYVPVVDGLIYMTKQNFFSRRCYLNKVDTKQWIFKHNKMDFGALMVARDDVVCCLSTILFI
jgi:hypothetical protein